MIRTTLLLLVSLGVLLSACGGGHKVSVPVVENIYVQHMKDFTHVGVEAMHQERWASAEHAFERALQMSKLANAPAKITAAWYNLAMAYKAEGQADKAETALQKVLMLAQRHAFLAHEKRAELQLALLHLGRGETIEDMQPLPSNLPADIYLMAAKLAYLQHQILQSKQSYKQAILVAGNKRSGLLLRAKALMGLSLLAKEQGDALEAKEQALKVLQLCEQVGAPRLSADVSLLLAGLESEVSMQERLDYVERARDIYLILHDEEGELKTQQILKEMGK
jgi:tetratricopeptide (TPR) repeat protein